VENFIFALRDEVGDDTPQLADAWRKFFEAYSMNCLDLIHEPDWKELGKSAPTTRAQSACARLPRAPLPRSAPPRRSYPRALARAPGLPGGTFTNGGAERVRFRKNVRDLTMVEFNALR
jgi:hypothetical protein